MKYFSAKELGFYCTETVPREAYEMAGTWPDDAMVITDKQYQNYLITAPEGKVLGAVNGMPAWVNSPEPSQEYAILLAEMKKQQLMASAEEAIAPLSRAVKYGIATNEEKAKLESLERYTVLLSRVSPADAPNIVWPEKPE